MLWFRFPTGTNNAYPNRMSGTVAPPGPCGGDYSGHPILPGNRVTQAGLYELYGISVPLLDIFNNVSTMPRLSSRKGAAVANAYFLDPRRNLPVSADGRVWDAGRSRR